MGVFKLMKILWLSHLVPYPPKGGVLQRSFNLLREVSKSNKIYLLAFNQKALLPTEQDLENAVSALREYCHDIKVVSLPADRNIFSRYSLIIKSIFAKKPYTVNWNRSLHMKVAVDKAINEFKPDLIHYDTIGKAEYFKYNISIPQVLNHHNIESAMMFRRATKERNVLKKFYFYQEAKKIEKYEKTFCRLFQSNLTVSDEDGLTLKKIDPEIKTEVIPNGVDTSYFTPGGEKSDNETLIFAGGMNWYPNRDAMLYFAEEIWPLIKARKPSVKIYIIGQSPPEKLMRMSKEDPNLIVTGYVDDVRPYFTKASVYVCPIRDGGGTRLKILDALSSGIPVVANSIAAEGIKVTPGEDIMIRDRPEDFAEAVLYLLEHPDERRKLSLHGRRMVETTYSWEIIGKKLSNLYERLV
jgi:sugar transferase (PEP-CTERM/EpsH1 system associated)